ncbi:hypothetical protein QRD89_06920 [Halobacillus sp. ACCC02827]|uniref:hypothetical protein n=1 Tax=Bacillaceae TaxID=186817 RepID=UPI0002A4D140|nr:MULTISPECIES: hypothetical protein [Bacillaceae]ELK46031.1 hypothetical protein D479_12348 [Halobacillus sp. BAB-2008]QHT46256.1 hypothetical protein M662_07025 [Bacillus sp. SB49]WJE17076.1 hypothetical protein QRD89_06920 [Halobacillus sp. ACCC02827]
MEQKQQMDNEQAPMIGGLQWKHMIGFVLCVVLAAFSLTGAMYSHYEPTFVLYILSGVAFVQAMIQLFKAQPIEDQ